MLEFFDQTKDKIDLYVPDGRGGHQHLERGYQFKFTRRTLRDKNFVLPIDNNRNDVITYYFRMQTSASQSLILTTGFLNTDGSLDVVAMNKASKKISCLLSIHGQVSSITVLLHSISAIVMK